MTADDKTIRFGEAIPTFTYTLSEALPEEILAELLSKTEMASSALATAPDAYAIVLAFREGATSETALANYSVTLQNATLTVCKKYEIDGVQVDGLDPSKDYEVQMTAISPDDTPNVRKTKIDISILDSEGEAVPYVGEADLTVAIPDGIDPDYFDLYTENDEGEEAFVDPSDYDVTEDGEIVIHTDVPVTLVFKNRKGQIFVKADDKTIHDGDELPVYTFTVTGWTDDGDSLREEEISAAIAAVSASTNYRTGETGEFIITTAFILQKDQYNVVEGFRVLLQEGALYVLPKVLVDNAVEVTLEDEEEAFDLDISLKVEVKSTIEKVDYEAITAKYVDKRSEISSVYNVKLYRTEIVNGITTIEEIQPSDIKEGASIIVKMAIPEHLIGRSFRVLHIHSAEDVEYVDESNMEIKDGCVFVKVNRLSEFAFVNLKDSEEMDHSSFCLGWLAFIFDGAFLLYFVIRFLLRKRTARTGIGLIVSIIEVIISALILAFSITVIVSHLCVISIVSIVLASLLFGASVALLIKRKTKAA